MNPYLLLAGITCSLVLYTTFVMMLSSLNISVGWSLAIPYTLMIGSLVVFERKRRQSKNNKEHQAVKVRPDVEQSVRMALDKSISMQHHSKKDSRARSSRSLFNQNQLPRDFNKNKITDI